MPFCSQSRPLLDFSVWSGSHLECVDLCKVILLCLWILCSILSVSQGTNCGLLASSKSLPLFPLLIFFTSLVGKLWVCNCLEGFLCFGPFVSIWSFLWLSIRVRVLFVGIYSFLVLVWREWRCWQIHPTRPKHYCIVWNEPPQALASMSMHTKLNTCAIIKKLSFPH